MLGKSRPVPFDPYGRRRARVGVPKWLLLLVSGIVIGAGGVIFAQQRYLPERLTPEASAELRGMFQQAEATRVRQQAELTETRSRLETTLTENKTQAEALASKRSGAQAVQQDLDTVVALLPPDPRGGAVQVRAGRLVAKDGKLNYELVLTHDGAAGKPVAASIRFSVTGDGARGGATTFSSEPIDVSIASQDVLRGSVALPGGFVKPQQSTVQIVERASSKALGMRVLLVK